MSHIETAKVQIIDLTALKTAVKHFEAELLEQKTFNSFTPRNACDYAIRVPGIHYQIGVVKNKAEEGEKAKGYSLAYDFYGSGGTHDGNRLRDKFGSGLNNLVDRYSIEVLKRQARAKGYLSRESLVDGKLTLTVTGFA